MHSLTSFLTLTTLVPVFDFSTASTEIRTVLTTISDGVNSVTESVTIEGVDTGAGARIQLGGGQEDNTAKLESILFCFSVGPTFTPGEAVDEFLDTSDEATDTFLSGIFSIVRGFIASILGGFSFF